MRWEDCVKRDVRKAGEEEDWKKTRDRGGWKRLSDEAVKKLQAAPHPCQREKRREREKMGVGVTQDVALDRKEWRRRTRPSRWAWLALSHI